MLFQLLIDGTLQAGASTIDVINPATGRLLAVVPRADSIQAEHAIAAANRAFPKWSALSYVERRKYLDKVADAIEARLLDFSRLLTQEQGKPIEQATGEMVAPSRRCATSLRRLCRPSCFETQPMSALSNSVTRSAS